MGIPVVPFTPTRGNDKHTRVNSVAPVFESGAVWYPYGEKFAEDVIDECAAFPNGANDDYVDSTTQAILRYRQGNFVELYSDYVDNEESVRKTYNYY
jgi:predicted phage terminase large subunit-like protein